MSRGIDNGAYEAGSIERHAVAADRQGRDDHQHQQEGCDFAGDLVEACAL